MYTCRSFCVTFPLRLRDTFHKHIHILAFRFCSLCSLFLLMNYLLYPKYCTYSQTLNTRNLLFWLENLSVAIFTRMPYIWIGTRQYCSIRTCRVQLYIYWTKGSNLHRTILQHPVDWRRQKFMYPRLYVCRGRWLGMWWKRRITAL